MRIGVDFDNTLACYDHVFHAAAVERGLIPASVRTDKTSVRDYLRALDRDADFTGLQGYIYGPGMKHVVLYPGAREALARAVAGGHTLFLVSHKSRNPFAGPPYDLHEAARGFLRAQGLMSAPDAPFLAGNVHFELTKEAKVARIAAVGCDIFIDDLPEILSLPGFPPEMRAILFDPDGHYPVGEWQGSTFQTYRTWHDLAAAHFGPSNGRL